MKKIILTLFVLANGLALSAQTTGSFEQNVTFTQADYNFTRTLYYYVPSDYDSNQSYKLVVGFRGGPHSNAGQFRDQLTFLADSIGAIILCPENADHFWNEEGLTKKLFQYSLEKAMEIYNIDPNFIYLTGLSYGGRHAVITGMSSDEGGIPTLRGIIPFAAGSDSQLQPNYDSIEEFAPACICIGLNDSSNFINVSNTLYNDIISHGGSAFLNEISGVGHTVNFPTYESEMMECFNFIESYHLTNAFKEPISSAIKVLVSPNPAYHSIAISYSQGLTPEKIFLIDATGKVRIDITPSQKTIDISNLPNGIASLVIMTKENMIIKRIVIMH